MFSQGSQRQYDAIVIGSGMTGGWAAKELTERGLRTLVLEAGGPIVPERDYGEHVPLWDMPYRGRRNRKQLLERQFVQRHCYACDEIGSRFFIDDIDNPYTTPDEKPFSWFRGRQVGGRSIMWGRQVYRWSDLDFEANAREGIGIDWPIRYKDLTPWYEHVESFIGVSGQPERLAHLPDGSFLPAMPMNCVERHVRDRMRTHFGPERMLTIGRTAVLTVPHKVGRRVITVGHATAAVSRDPTSAVSMQRCPLPKRPDDCRYVLSASCIALSTTSGRDSLPVCASLTP
jgi:choline dehydrogenase-like flavoprotein